MRIHLALAAALLTLHTLAPNPRRDLVTLDAAADYLGVDKRTVRTYIAQGRFNAYRIGNRLLRVDLNEVEATLHPIPNAKTGVA
jgi:excisionase family DNA binding protein